MKAIVLSPGPSLADYIPQTADLTLAVNRAALRFSCDLWVCGDTPLIQQCAESVIGAPVLVTYHGTIDALRDHHFAWRNTIEAWTPLAETYLHTSVINWPWCSFCSAIVYATWKGATQIEVYGADWCGTADYDGVEAGKNRTDDRWRHERGLFDALVKHFQPSVSINRCWIKNGKH